MVLFTDYMPLLIKAAEEGTVNTKWTNFSIGGASGTGKTSVLHLLLDEPPPTNTTVLKSYSHYLSVFMNSKPKIVTVKMDIQVLIQIRMTLRV